MLSNATVSAVLPASDFGRARKFYTESLGLEIAMEDPGGIVLKAGGGTLLFLYPSEFAGTNQATAAGFMVDDLNAAMKALEAKGVTFEEYDLPGIKTEKGIVTLPDGSKGAWFKDTESNIISLTQRA